jgi:hypothetical protein
MQDFNAGPSRRDDGVKRDDRRNQLEKDESD